MCTFVSCQKFRNSFTHLFKNFSLFASVNFLYQTPKIINNKYPYQSFRTLSHPKKNGKKKYTSAFFFSKKSTHVYLSLTQSHEPMHNLSRYSYISACIHSHHTVIYRIVNGVHRPFVSLTSRKKKIKPIFRENFIIHHPSIQNFAKEFAKNEISKF